MSNRSETRRVFAVVANREHSKAECSSIIGQTLSSRRSSPDYSPYAHQAHFIPLTALMTRPIVMRHMFIVYNRFNSTTSFPARNVVALHSSSVYSFNLAESSCSYP